MDGVVESLLQALESAPPPCSDESPMIVPYDRLCGAVACAIESRSTYIVRFPSRREEDAYHTDVRLRLPRSIREAAISRAGESVDWRHPDLLPWACGLFVNAAEMRVATALEKTLRIVAQSDDMSFTSVLDDAREAMAACADAVGAADRLKHTQDRSVAIGLFDLLQGTTTLERTIERLNVPPENRSLALGFTWEKCNRQKHDRTRRRDWADTHGRPRKRSGEQPAVKGGGLAAPSRNRAAIKHLSEPQISWGILAVSILSVLEIYTAVHAIVMAREQRIGQ